MVTCVIDKPEPFTEADLAGIVSIAASWPTHFTPEGVSAIESDARRHQCLVIRRNHAPAAFIVWVVTATEMELLWLATEPRYQGQGLATMLVKAVEATVTSQRIITFKTATLDSVVENRRFDANAFHSTHAFFSKLGYEQDAVIDSFWDKGNHAAIWAKKLWNKQE